MLTEVNGVSELHLYRYDKIIGFWSPAPANSSSKPPWGALQSCLYKPDQGEVGDYFEMKNETGSKRLFKNNIMDPSLWDINNFTQKCSELRVSHKEELLGVYLTLLNSAGKFRFHNPAIHYEHGFLIDGSGIQIDDFEKNGDSLIELKEFLKSAQTSAVKVQKRQDVLK